MVDIPLHDLYVVLEAGYLLFVLDDGGVVEGEFAELADHVVENVDFIAYELLILLNKLLKFTLHGGNFLFINC